MAGALELYVEGRGIMSLPSRIHRFTVMRRGYITERR